MTQKSVTQFSMTRNLTTVAENQPVVKAFVMEADVVRAMAKLGSPRSQARKLYKAMQDYYVQELVSKGLINPGTKGVPKAVAEKYLSLYGIAL